MPETNQPSASDLINSGRFSNHPDWLSPDGRWVWNVALSLAKNHEAELSKADSDLVFGILIYAEPYREARKKLRQIVERFPIGTIWFEHCPDQNPYNSPNTGRPIITEADRKEEKLLQTAQAKTNADISAQIAAVPVADINAAKAAGEAARRAGELLRSNPHQRNLILNAAWEIGWRKVNIELFNQKGKEGGC